MKNLPVAGASLSALFVIGTLACSGGSDPQDPATTATGGTSSVTAVGSAGTQVTDATGGAGGAAPATPPPPPGELAGSNPIRHFAVVCSGPSHTSTLAGFYAAANRYMFDTLRDVYGYPEEAIFRLYEDPSYDAQVDGAATLDNFVRVFQHLAAILHADDRLFVFVVGHGNSSPVYELGGGLLTGADFDALLDALPTRQVDVVMNPCQSGGFVPDLSAEGRVLCTSTLPTENNSVGWAETFERALGGVTPGADADGDGRISMKEAYDATVPVSAAGGEHPLLDDDGDGVGHNGVGVVGGDGALAATRYLGDDGRPLAYSAANVQALAELNARLEL